MTLLSVYFKKPSHWEHIPYIHFWDTEHPNDSNNWPGVLMEEGEVTGWFVYRFQTSSAHFVINDGQDQQTQDYYRDQDGPVAEKESMVDEKPIAVNNMPILEKAASMVNSFIRTCCGKT